LPPPPPSAELLVFSTLGHGSNEEHRIRTLAGRVPHRVFPFDRSKKVRMFWRLLGELRRGRPPLAVMEGTGLAGGAALILARLLFGRRYVVSSGDAVGPWVASRVRPLGPVFGLYERVLCRLADGFIGWTPYLVGRALTFGCRRGVTAAGWAPFTRTAGEREADRRATRTALGIPAEHLVVGIAGSMVWNRRYRYCYGAELVEAARLVRRPDVTFLVVGDGTGKGRLEARAAGLPPHRVVFTGRVPQADLPAYYAAMDAGSLPQSVDRVGGFRYTTKVSEYIAFGLPIVTGQIPLAYDLDDGGVWRLPGDAPWEPGYARALAGLVDRLTADEVAAKAAALSAARSHFDPEVQTRRVTDFLNDLIVSRHHPRQNG
jgi:hypothetical protein